MAEHIGGKIADRSKVKVNPYDLLQNKGGGKEKILYSTWDITATSNQPPTAANWARFKAVINDIFLTARIKEFTRGEGTDQEVKSG